MDSESPSFQRGHSPPRVRSQGLSRKFVYVGYPKEMPGPCGAVVMFGQVELRVVLTHPW